MGCPYFEFKHAIDAVDFMCKLQTFSNISGVDEEESAETIELHFKHNENMVVTPIRNGVR